MRIILHCVCTCKFGLRGKMRAKCKIPLFVLISIHALGNINAQKTCHPLDPLSPDEIEATVQIVSSKLPVIRHQGTWAFNGITLKMKEPVKALLLPYFLQDHDPPCTSFDIPRRAFVQLVEKQQNIVTEVIVNLFTRTVESWKRLPRGTQATYTVEEDIVAEHVTKNDPQVQERCNQMGWTNLSLVITSSWSVAYAEDIPVLKNAIRPVIVYLWGQLFDGDNQFAHPFDFAVSVDLTTQKVLAINNLPTHSDFDPNNRFGNVCPKTPANYNPRWKPSNFLRTDLHPIQFTQQHGPSFTIRGNEISWQKFKIRIGFNAREALVIHHVSYQDGPNRRPLFYRMSVSELFVPYGDPRPPFHQKFPFDAGEFTLSSNIPDHKVSGICRGGIVAYMTVFIHDETGTIVPKPNAICIHEEDAGLLWAHKGRDSRVVHARSQRLTITCMASMSNYDYKFSWRFYQDASIEMNTELSGILVGQLHAQNETIADGFGVPVIPQINGQRHQHFFALRLDTEIDGNINTVSTVDTVKLPDPTGSTTRNPYGQGWTTVERLLRTPAEARSVISPLTGREWLIRNPTRVHPYTKKPVAWKLVPHSTPGPLIHKDSPLHPRCAFTDYNVWVTKYKDDQLYPAGVYLGLNSSGLPEWVAEKPNEDLTRTDVVLWYILGYTHSPRVEDFPIMPIQSISIHLKPSNFFLGNPALDVPPPS